MISPSSLTTNFFQIAERGLSGAGVYEVVTEKDALNLFSSFLRDIHNLFSIKFPFVKCLLRVQRSRNR